MKKKKVIIIIVILINFIIPPIIQSIIDLTTNFSTYYEIAVGKINELPEDSFWKTEVVTRVMQEIQNIDLKQIKIQPTEVDGVKWASIEQIKQMKQENKFHDGHYTMFLKCLEYLDGVK